MRKRFSTRERARIFELHARKCHICGGPIEPGQAWELEHVVPFELTHDDSDANVRPAHVKCHRTKTTEDIDGIRKADRIKAKHEGTWQTSRRWFGQYPKGENHD